RMLRPMRPKPLIATRTAIDGSLGGREVCAGARDAASLQLSRYRFNHGLGCNAKVVVEGLCGTAGAKIVHADETAPLPEKLAPTHVDAGFDGNSCLGITDDPGAVALGLFGEEFHRWHRDDL